MPTVRHRAAAHLHPQLFSSRHQPRGHLALAQPGHSRECRAVRLALLVDEHQVGLPDAVRVRRRSMRVKLEPRDRLFSVLALDRPVLRVVQVEPSQPDSPLPRVDRLDDPDLVRFGTRKDADIAREDVCVLIDLRDLFELGRRERGPRPVLPDDGCGRARVRDDEDAVAFGVGRRPARGGAREARRVLEDDLVVDSVEVVAARSSPSGAGWLRTRKTRTHAVART